MPPSDPQTTPIPKEEFERARRALCRRIGAEIVRAMALVDADFARMGERMDRPEEYVRTCVHQLIDGTPLDLTTISDLALALGGEWDIKVIETRHD